MKGLIGKRVIFFDTVENKVLNAILTAIDSIITSKIELAIRSINASFGRDATNFMASSERGEQMGIIVHFGNVTKRNNTLQVFDTNDET